MRSALQLVALVAALVACAADPIPITACTAGVSTACTCSSGATGAQVCRADGSGYGACVCTSDAGADAVGDVAVGDAGADAAGDVPGLDVAVDALQLDAAGDGGADAVAVGDASDGSADAGDGRDPRCNPGFTRCETPTPGCFDLQTETFHCGTCSGQCPGPMWGGCRNGMCVP